MSLIVHTKIRIAMSRFRPALAAGLLGFAAVHSAAQPYVIGWGNNEFGQISTPPGLTNVAAISAGDTHSVALLSNGTVVAWGILGTTNVPPGLSNVAAISASYEYTLALKSNGTVVAWGVNDFGQTNIPPGLSNVTAISAGFFHALALKNDGTVVSWGIGPGTNVPSGLSSVMAIAAGDDHSLALKSDGTVTAWGANSFAQTNVPAGLSGVAAISAGYNFSEALKSNGTVVAWGINASGQTNLPDGLSNVVAISAGGYHSLALTTNGTVIAWGDNGYGQTVVPPGLSGVVAIAGGGQFSLALGYLPLFIVCPSDLTITSTNALQPPNPSSVLVSNGCGGVVVTYFGDVTVVNGCSNIIYRAYQAVDNCHTTAACVQMITVRNAPQILGFFISQNVVPDGVQVVYCANVVGNGLTYNWSVEVGEPLSSFQSGNCFFVTYSATDTNANTVNLNVINACGGVSVGSPPTTTCGICLSRGVPNLLSGTDGSGAGPTLTVSNCGTLGPNAKWFKLVATNGTGLVTLSTEGSGSSNTILAVYIGPITSASALTNVACSGGISASNGQSRVTFTAQQGSVYWIVVDPGTNAAGLRLASGFEPILTNYTYKPDRTFELNSTIAPAIPYRILATTNAALNLTNWSTLLTTNLNSSFPYLYYRDTNATNFPSRFYRIAPGS